MNVICLWSNFSFKKTAGIVFENQKNDSNFLWKKKTKNKDGVIDVIYHKERYLINKIVLRLNQL